MTARALEDEGALTAAHLHLAELEYRAGNWPLAGGTQRTDTSAPSSSPASRT